MVTYNDLIAILREINRAIDKLDNIIVIYAIYRFLLWKRGSINLNLSMMKKILKDLV